MLIILKGALYLLHYLIECIVAFITLYFLLFFGGGLISTGTLSEEGEIMVFVQTNGVHTDLCLPVETEYNDWKNIIPLSDYPAVSSPQFISIGWGDKGFFLDTPEWSDLTFSTGFNAAFLNTGTAMHVIYHEKTPQVSERRRKVMLDKANYLKLIGYIKNSFKWSNNEPELIPNRGYWRNDNFYEATGNYNLFKTCNSWTNDALKITGVRTGIYALSSNGIMSHLKKN